MVVCAEAGSFEFGSRVHLLLRMGFLHIQGSVHLGFNHYQYILLESNQDAAFARIDVKSVTPN
jgi:hypothetical protein